MTTSLNVILRWKHLAVAGAQKMSVSFFLHGRGRKRPQSCIGQLLLCKKPHQNSGFVFAHAATSWLGAQLSTVRHEGGSTLVVLSRIPCWWDSHLTATCSCYGWGRSAGGLTKHMCGLFWLRLRTVVMSLVPTSQAWCPWHGEIFTMSSRRKCKATCKGHGHRKGKI